MVPAPALIERRTFMRIHLRGLGTALAAGAIAVAACGGSTAGSGGGGSSVCGRYYDTLVANCMGSVPPAAELARERARFDQACVSALALPGISVTAAGLDACSSAIQARGCNAVFQGGTCNFGPGSLADGAHCGSPNQCMSDNCTAGQSTSGSAPTACGTCVAGSMCGTAVCANNTVCVPNGTGQSCAPISFGSAGAACDGLQTQCNPGLVCNQMSHTCAQPGAMGSPCVTALDCGDSLVCPLGPQGMGSKCQNRGLAGAACQSDGDCTADLGCDDATHTCATLHWASAGQACGATTRCLVGSCSNSATASATCPTVIADGQPCNGNDATQTCDTFATCVGTCQILGATACP
jgi:hypothetical protein